MTQLEAGTEFFKELLRKVGLASSRQNLVPNRQATYFEFEKEGRKVDTTLSHEFLSDVRSTKSLQAAAETYASQMANRAKGVSPYDFYTHSGIPFNFEIF